MKIDQIRYGIVGGIVKKEVTTWIPASDLNIDQTDRRLRSIPGHEGLFFALSVSNPLMDFSQFDNYKDATGAIVPPDDSSFFDPTSNTLAPGVVLGTENDYNNYILSQQTLAEANAASIEQFKTDREAQLAQRIAIYKKLGLSDEEIAVL